MSFLIQSEWVRQEAAEQDVRVTDREVRRAFDQQKRQAFTGQGDYRAFLRSAEAAERDILVRVEIEALQAKLADRVAGDDEQMQQYVEDLHERFSERTSCADAYAVRECGH